MDYDRRFLYRLCSVMSNLGWAFDDCYDMCDLEVVIRYDNEAFPINYVFVLFTGMSALNGTALYYGSKLALYTLGDFRCIVGGF